MNIGWILLWLAASYQMPVETFVDFGHAVKGQTYYTTVYLANKTDKTCKITRTRSVCKCAVSQIDYRTLAAGDSVAIRMKLDYSPDLPDSTKQSVYILTESGEDKKNYIYHLTARSDKPQMMSVRDDIIKVTPISKTDLFRGEVKIKNTGKKPIKVKPVYMAEDITIDRRFPVSIAPGKTEEFTVEGRIDSFLTIRSITLEAGDGVMTERLSLPIEIR
jgi:hypothetical protein